MFSDVHIMAGMSRSLELLEQSQKIARIGSWEWLMTENKALCTDQLFDLLDIPKTGDNMMSLEHLFCHAHPDDQIDLDQLCRQLETSRHLEYRHRRITSSGKIRHMHCWCEGHFMDGKLFKIRGTCQDMSSFIHLEQELAKKTADLLRAEEIDGSGSYKINFTTHSYFFSDNLQRIFGYQPGELPTERERALSHIHPDDTALVLETYERAQNVCQTHNHKVRILRKDGALRHIIIKGQSYRSNKDEQVLEGVIKDVTESVVLEDNLERQNDMLRLAETTAQLGSWKYNFITNQISFSDNFYRLLGYEVDAFRNDAAPILNLIPNVDLARIQTTYRAIAAEGKPRSVDFRVRRPDGALRFFASSGKTDKNRKGEDILVGMLQDITEQHLLKTELEEQNDFVQKLVDSSLNYAAVVDSQKRFTLWNKKCEKTYGLTREQVIGKSIVEVYPENDILWIDPSIDRALAGEKVTLEQELHQTGQHYQFYFIPVSDISGNITQAFILAHDITTLTNLNAQITKQKEFAEAVVDHSQACIFVFDTAFRCIVWNKKCEEFYGIPREKALGKTLSEMFPEGALAEPVARLHHAINTGATAHYPAEHSRILDKYHDSYVVPMKDEHGNISSVLCVLNDVTNLTHITNRIKDANSLLELRTRELTERTNFLESLLDTSTDYIGAYGKDLSILEINKISCERYGLEKDKVLGKRAQDVFPGIENTVQMRYLEKALAGETTHGFEFSGLDEGIHFSASYVPLKDASGNIFGALAVGHDITELKKTVFALAELNKELATKNHELDRINSELASFSYVASHDLQEPLRKIQAFISLLLSKDAALLSDPGKDYFQRIQASANRMQQMIDGLLTFSRTNTTPKTFEQKELSPILQRVCEQLCYENRHIQPKITIDTPHSVRVITHQIEQLLEHLISNALKFQPEGNNPHIEITSSMIAGKEIVGEVAMRNSDYCRISIKDNGIGFDMDDAEKIFQMFQRLQGRNEFSGTGIGLSVCRRIAQNHDGFIIVESKPRKGSTFHVYLPDVPSSA